MTTSTSTNLISRQIRRGDSYVYVHGHLGSCVRINSSDTNTDTSIRLTPTEARATAAYAAYKKIADILCVELAAAPAESAP